jgi:DNA-binding NarL/FixJ family response regulator
MWHVLIVEDDPEMREYFASCIEGAEQLALVAKVGTFTGGLACLNTLSQPIDVLLTDIGLPDGSGLDLIRHARLHRSDCESLVISMFGDEENVIASIEAGALGYIYKDESAKNIALSILEMKAGGSPISPMIARRVLSKYVAPASAARPMAPAASSPPAPEPAVKLSTREQEVLDLISRGFSYAEIGRIQGISVHTVQTHIKKLYAKLVVHSKSEAVYEATRMGLIR